MADDLDPAAVIAACGYGPDATGHDAAVVALIRERVGRLTEQESAILRYRMVVLTICNRTLKSAIDYIEGSLREDIVEGYRQHVVFWCRRLCAFLGVPAGPGVAHATEGDGCGG